MDSFTISNHTFTDPPIEEAYDVVIVGAGPGGSSAAQAAAHEGAQVLLIDAKRCIGTPVQCGELVSQWVSRYVDISANSIQQKVDRMVTHLPDGSSYEMVGPGFMLDRSIFDRELAALASRSGATLSIGTRALTPTADGLVIKKGSQSQRVRAKAIIAADGARSTVARWLGLPQPRMILAVQYEVVLSKPQDHVDIFFDPEYEGGYGWFFPKGKTANVGVGTVDGGATLLTKRLQAFLNRLLQAQKLTDIALVGKTGGFIPCESRPKTVFENILLVGDAAGHAHPITGAGILHAVIAGQIAGRVAAEAVKAGNLDHLACYETEWRTFFGETLAYGAQKRVILETEWKDPKPNFESLIRRTWVGFKTYHEQRRGKEAWQTR